ncbi:MAG: methyltransferase domain-containing protein [Pirellulales bacterium]|nr:methyltransferase domain-containing protein [Pirellulales bacterium]
MHDSIDAFIQSAAEALELEAPVYEFCCVQGRGSREGALPGNFCVGIGSLDQDAAEGTELDWVDDVARLPYANGAARTIACTNVLEHVHEPQRAVDEMLRVLGPGGLLLVSTSLAAHASASPGLHWRPTPHRLLELLSPVEASMVGWLGSDQSPHTYFAVGCKAPAPASLAGGMQRLIHRLPTRLDEAARRSRGSGRLRRVLLGWMRTKAGRQRERDWYKAKFILHMPADERFQHQLLANCLQDSRSGPRMKASG